MQAGSEATVVVEALVAEVNSPQSPLIGTQVEDRDVAVVLVVASISVAE